MISRNLVFSFKEVDNES